MNDRVYIKERLEGSSALARALGVRREQIWAVRTGRCVSKRIAEALQARGIQVKSRQQTADKSEHSEELCHLGQRARCARVKAERSEGAMSAR